MEKLEIQSPAFATGAPIPKEYTQQGSDMSPPLEITNIPKGTQSLVLVCVDPDAPDPEAPKLTFVHWVAYNTRMLPHRRFSRPVPSTTRTSLHNGRLSSSRTLMV